MTASRKRKPRPLRANRKAILVRTLQTYTRELLAGATVLDEVIDELTAVMKAERILTEAFGGASWGVFVDRWANVVDLDAERAKRATRAEVMIAALEAQS